MRAVLMVLAAAGLAACSPAVPDSGVGFGDYASYMRDRERALASGAPLAPAVVSPAPTGFSTDAVGAAIDRAATGPTGGVAPATGGTGALIGSPGERPRGDAPATIRTESGEMARVGISDEQDFSAVASRETIESDAERLARARSQYQVVQPGALPERRDSGGSALVNFALSTAHAPGTPVYRRSSFGTKDPMANCGRYASPDLAQQAFLDAGGPERDRLRLDPDGDGFVCGWDPRPFRAARGG